MKKILALTMIMVAAGCSWYNQADEYIENYKTYPVYLYGETPEMVNVEYYTVRTHPLNTVLTSYVGYSVVDKKMYSKNTYTTEEVQVAKSGTIIGSSSNISLKKGEVKKVAGSVILNEKEYLLLPVEPAGYYILMNNQTGKLLNRMGRLKGDRLTVLDAKYNIAPKDFGFKVVNKARSKETAPELGFDVKYGGIKDGKMVFTYLDYSQMKGNRGYFEDITFPIDQQNVEIEEAGFRVIKADKDKIEYVILK